MDRFVFEVLSKPLQHSAILKADAKLRPLERLLETATIAGED
jgi:hypothetical protein